MNKKMLIAIAIAQVILIGSLFAIATGNNDTIKTDTTDATILDACTGDCLNCTSCDGQGDCSGACNSQGSQNCDGTGSCNQNKISSTNGYGVCDGSGTCGRNTQQYSGCGSRSSCSGSCNN